jgi:hypothetical protein
VRQLYRQKSLVTNRAFFTPSAENYDSAAKICPMVATESPAGGGEQTVSEKNPFPIAEPAYNLQVVPKWAINDSFCHHPRTSW